MFLDAELYTLSHQLSVNSSPRLCPRPELSNFNLGFKAVLIPSSRLPNPFPKINIKMYPISEAIYIVYKIMEVMFTKFR